MGSTVRHEKNLVWLDLEMTGLDPERHTILEIATIVTDSDLNVLAEGPCLPVRHPEKTLSSMDPWCLEHHGGSGLIQRVRGSGVAMAAAEERTLRFVQEWCLPRASPLCGNTIGQDRRFLLKYMPRLHDFFHYRSIDVSTLKELVLRWYPPESHFPQKPEKHEALEDVRDSLRELAFYRKTVFR
ncbi:MAG: oligoribonuclease [Elusimicrobia bacterium]|nr:oligoribonuclease [Elusimicrobiota bacterium]